MQITRIPLDTWPGHSPPTKQNDRVLPIRYIVLHSTGGTNSADWLSKWNRKEPTSKQNNVSIQYLVRRDGNVYQIIDDSMRAWHVGTCRMPDGETDGNGCSIGIEIEHLNEPDYPEAQMTAIAQLIDDKMSTYGILSANVVSHASIALPKGRKIDPVNFDWADLWSRIIARNNKPILAYTANSTTLGTPGIDEDRLIQYISTKFSKFAEYTQADVRSIVTAYIKYGKQTDVNWLFALAQCIHETGWFKSWWAARQRRNPAGIGVTGQTSLKKPADADNWAYDGTQGIWRRGQSFKSWDIAVQHHYGRLLCYALKDNEMTSQQQAFSNIISGKDRLVHIRGCAPTFIGFNGIWAVPGTTYAQSIAKIMNSFITASQ